MQLHNLVQRAALEAHYPALTDDYTDSLIQHFSTDENSCLFYEEHGFIAGSIIDTHILLPDTRLALEVAWYVRPEHRNKMCGGRLYKLFEKWAIEKKAVYIFQGIKSRDSIKVSEVHVRKL